MLTEILGDTLAEIDDVELVSERSSDAPEHLLIARAGVLTQDEVVRLLYEHPRLKVVTVQEVGAHAHLFELRPERVDLGELSSECLAELVHAAAEAA